MDFKKIEKETPQVYEKFAKEFDKNRLKNLFEKSWLDKFISQLEGGDVLDVGCGSGEPIAQYLIESGLNITGIDSSLNLLNIAKDRFPNAKWYHQDMRKLNIERKFNGIIAWNSFFHLNQSDQKQTLEVFKRHLNPNGILMFTAGPGSGEVTGKVAGQDVYHSSLSLDEYNFEFEKHNMTIIEHIFNDPDCNYHCIYLVKMN